ncbi:uncharacterized protein N0V89_007550 [Didymosphaeria variabile]|uniref:F-box domain-containing protein n=1 Tax=Didymosphaeria variabile TaxID=1932322 RepID=A0A9W8XLC4_9PLEO|nr:uncharacterized protein N0V89_007550 [Didymosphaeria variabile]KAJ4352203.1 hypothetical protein N0V89_007550 [Didymosphaeria variabile]
MFPLFSLPNELIATIVEALDDRPALVALAQTCQKLHPLAEARVFRNIYIRDGTSVARLAEILDQRPERFRMIKHLEATPTVHAWRRIEQMPELAGRMARLKSLKIEAPMINSGARPQWWSEGSMGEYMDLFEGRNQGLQNEARSQGSDFLRAIQQQSNSLEYLRFTHHPEATVDPGSPEHLNTSLVSSLATLRLSSTGLSTFDRLRTFDVDYRSNLAELLFVKELAPPSLHTLGLPGLNYEYESSWRHLPSYISAMASATPFSHLRLHTDPNRLDFDDVFKIFTSPVFTHTPHREVLLGIVEILKKRASVKLICASSRAIGCHPPYLYGEKMPEEAVVFDSEKPYYQEEEVDQRFEIEDYIPEDASGWDGPFSGLGTRPWRLARRT